MTVPVTFTVGVGESVIVLADADSTIPNLALMRIAAYWSARGESVRLVRPGERRSLWDGVPRHVYGSSIFTFAAKARQSLEREWGVEVWGGTGVSVGSSLSTIDNSVEWDLIQPQYAIYPDFRASIGFSQRGCRLKCPFCVVPKKEKGRPWSVGTLASIWRGHPHKRWILLLDNDPFGQPRDAWKALFQEARTGRFKLCFSQGINVRLIDDEAASALASIQYRDNEFQERRLYTAWDNLRDEGIFKRGVSTLQSAGIPAEHLMVYMLVGYREGETWNDLWYRFAELVSLGCKPYPMPFNRAERPDLCAFERWVKRGLYRSVPWPQYAADGREDTRLHGTAARAESDAAWFRVIGAKGLKFKDRGNA